MGAMRVVWPQARRGVQVRETMRFRLWLMLYRIAYWLLGRAKPERCEFDFVVEGTRYVGYELIWSDEDGKIVGRLRLKGEVRETR